MPRRSSPASRPASLPAARAVAAPTAARPLTSLSRRALLAGTAATAVAVPAGAAVLAPAPALADPAVTDGRTRVVDVPLAEVPLVEEDGAAVRDLAEQPATMIGVTWPPETDAPTVRARGLDGDGTWTAWMPLETEEDPETGEDAAGTEAGWLGAVSALQIRAELDGEDVTESLVARVVTTSPAPTDERVAEMSGPDARIGQDEQARRASTGAAAAVNPVTPELGPGAPAYVSRVSWGADESAVRGTSSASRLKAVIIHHTAGTNSYTSAQSAQIVRGILAYHTESLGWADIGYNVLVSKYGQIFEGRSGGLHRHIVGAHAYGFNTGSFGISVMGDHSATAVPSAARSAVSGLVAWRLLSTFQTEVRGTASWTPGSGTRFPEGVPVTLPRMLGHRDVNHTECPGQRLYDQFGAIRDEAQAAVDGGWTTHLRAYERGGGSEVLGPVVRTAHVLRAPERDRVYTVTVTGDGLVLDQGGAATAYVSPMAGEWTASWGRPAGRPSADGDRTVQAFSFGMAALEDGAVRFVEPGFADVPPGRAFFLDIADLVEAGVVNGFGGTEYRPDELLRRDHLIVFLHRAMGSPASTPPVDSPFSDVPTSHAYYRQITWAQEQGIVTGRADGTFEPAETVRRDHLATILWNAAGRPSAPAGGPYTDVPATHPHASAISWLAETGITRGYADGRYLPGRRVPRDQMSAFLIRWMRITGRL
ncbi:S-layer homology domain-containing protein [Brachybacterium sp. AOP43-C2-M15]|uniref:S-layer homology domain-containing protein n=1 Tax=Brachybacterium sp. AOP43-C2-M15 TaxID=3457661 RepID=UPI004033C5EE